MTGTAESYLSFPSRQSTVVELMEALKDTNIHMIGVWGMGGIGKTTLVTEVSSQAVGEKLFFEKAMADVGQSPNIIRIQGEIADMIRLKLEGETEVGRAEHLAQRLIKDTKALVILDNIWKTLDLKKIGIPCKGCKVILISRNRDVLRQIGIQKGFGLTALHKEEAWNLAVKTVGNSIEGLEFQEIATELVKKCAGLPVALEAVFKALKDKSIEEWKEAFQRWKDTLQRLQTSTLGIPIDMELTIYSCIELSYNQLKRREDKDFFLQCAQMPYPNSQMDLLTNCYGLRLFSDVYTLEGAKNTVCRLIRCLTDSGLLQDCSAVRGCQQRSEHFHMHDVVRDVARSIASTDHNMIVVRDGDLRKECLAEFVHKGCKALSIDAEDMHKIPTKMEFPELKLFSVTRTRVYFQETSDYLQISDVLFQGMKNLTVLEFKNVKLLSIPPSISFLVNLRTLKLDDCELEDITIIGNLKNLAILSLKSNNIQELPKEIGLLIHLQLLDLSYNVHLEVILPDVLSSLKELEELYFRDTKVKWKAEGVNSEKNCASLIELNHLSRLDTLEINIGDANYLPNDLLFPKLERFEISVGHWLDWYEQYETLTYLPNDLLFPKLERFEISVGHWLDWYEQYETPTLKLKNISSFQLVNTFKNLLNRTKSLLLDNLEGVNCALHTVDLQHLKHFKIHNSPKIEHVVDSRMSIIAFPSLETLHLKNMINLEEFCHGQLSSKCFDKLKAIEISDCGRLKYFISLSISSGLSQLEKLVIRDCSNMTTIFVKEESKIEERQTTFFPKLRNLTLQDLPKLQSFLSLSKSLGTNVEDIILEGKVDCCMQILHGEDMLPTLDQLFLDRIGAEDARHDHFLPNGLSHFLPNRLRVHLNSRIKNLLGLEVNALGNIKYLLSSSLKFMVQLTSLQIKKCKDLEEILLMEDLEMQEGKILFPKLELLFLEDLPILKRFCMGSNIRFPSLRKLKVVNCPRVKSFMGKPINSGTGTSEKHIEMSLQDDLHTFTEDLEMQEGKILFPKLELLFLEDLPILKRFCMGSNIRFPSLRELKVVNCPRVKSFMGKPVNSGTGTSEKHIEMNLEDDLHTFTEPFFSKVDAFPNLEALKIYNVVELKIIWPSYFPINSFCKLRKILIKSCENLTSIFQSNMLERFQNLKVLCVKDCGSLEQVIDLQGLNVEESHSRTTIQLEKLILCDLPKLRHVWNKGSCQFFSFQNLREVKANNCQSLKSVFPAFLVRDLTQLESLVITKCGVEEIVAMEETELPRDQIILPQVKFLHLADLPRLKQFLPGLHALKAKGYVDKVAFPNLENLKICNVVELKIICPSHFPVDSFRKLKKMHIESCGNLTSIFQYDILERFPELEKLCVKDCGSLEQVFNLEGLNVDERHIKITIQLKILIMCDLPKLRHVWNKDLGGSFSFQNLEQVEASNCQNLKSLFLPSAARQLMQLKVLFISNCGVEEIIAGDEVAPAMDWLIFPQVMSLSLRDLPRLKRVQLGLYTSELPKLTSIDIERCPFVRLPKWKEGNLEECQPETCDKHVHFLFDKDDWED